jgi:hypothetical protein
MAHRLYELVAERAHRRCEYCLAPESIFNSPFEVEHIIPRAAGGIDDEANLALACRSCNSSKFQATTASDPLSRRAVRLFHPRQDDWNEHFTFSVTSAEIVGRTAIGRASVARLRMNGTKEKEARRLWILYFGFSVDPEGDA